MQLRYHLASFCLLPHVKLRMGSMLFLCLVIHGLAQETPVSQLSSKLPLSKNIEFKEFLSCQLVPKLGNAWDYTFAPGQLPTIEWDRPEIVQKVMGVFPLKIRWFDCHGNEVDSAAEPGRYAFYAEGKTTNGVIIRRGGTLFYRSKEWEGWSEKPKAYLDFIPLDGLKRTSWDSHREAIAGFAGRTVLLSILRQQEGAILMSYLQEINTENQKASLLNTPLIRDHEYHLALKRQILNLSYPPFRLPQKDKTRPALMLHRGSEGEAGFRSGTSSKIRAICRGWFEESREPFNLVVARRGVMIINDTFGKWDWGAMTRETPTEMASITKLVTGLLFAQFVDQGLIAIDDPIGKYFPDFPTVGTNVLTLRHCFTHATALDGHEEWGGMHNPWLENVIANANDYLTPGQVHNYNGMGYDLAGKIMELVSGKSIFRLLRENLFDPLGMPHTTLEEDLGFSCFSTAADIAKLGQLLLNHGSYGSCHYFSSRTFSALLPQPLNRFYPAINKEWGIGITWMRQAHPQAGTGNVPKDQTILSRNTIGHGSATSAILRIDLDNELVIAQTRRRGGPKYDQYLCKLLLAIEAGLK